MYIFLGECRHWVCILPLVQTIIPAPNYGGSSGWTTRPLRKVKSHFLPRFTSACTILGIPRVFWEREIHTSSWGGQLVELQKGHWEDRIRKRLSSGETNYKGRSSGADTLFGSDSYKLSSREKATDAHGEQNKTDLNLERISRFSIP